MTAIRQRMWMPRPSAAALFSLLVLAGCGDGDGGGDDDADAAASDGEGSSYCADLERMMVAGVELNEALSNRDPAALQTAIDEYPGLAAAAAESAPPDIVDDVRALGDQATGMIAGLEGIDLSNQQAVETAVAGAVGGADASAEITEVGTRVFTHAQQNCDIDPAALANDTLTPN